MPITAARTSQRAVSQGELLVGESPFCIAVLSVAHDDKNGQLTWTMDQTNSAFENLIAPQFKMQEALKESSFFKVLATTEKGQEQLTKAVEAVHLHKEDRARAQSIEVLTLASADSGFPCKKHFDWIVTRGHDAENSVVLYGDPCNDKTMEQREQDAELVDFFHNAPIALHWLSGDGIVLWANKREIEVLGYTEEEYIGQPIMNFCPDEKELVLEIFKQLGSGNTIKDVPVRFRTKDGKIVPLLIDSNVKYDKYGNFQHTRCFIRDDTGRKIHEAKAQLLLEETKRSLKMLDNFMSRSLHHIRTPLHVLQSSVDLMMDNVHHMKRLATVEKVSSEFQETIQASQTLLEAAGEHITKSTELVDDITYLAKLDQQQELKLNPELVDLKAMGQAVFGLIEIPDGLECALEFHGGGSTHLNVDQKYLLKVLKHLLDHCANGVDPEHNFSDQPHRHISLVIGNLDNTCIFQVVVATGADLTSSDIMRLIKLPGAGGTPDEAGGGKIGTALPPIFQKYHQELLPDEIHDYEAAGDIRNKIEAGINSQKVEGLNVGLSLSYHLVAALGGDLRYSSRPTCKCFSFGIPHTNSQLVVERFVFKSKSKSKAGGGNSRFTKVPDAKPQESSKQDIVTQGAKAMDPPTILVVEDTPMCAKLLLRQLNKLNCSTEWAKNGQIAVDMVRANPDMYDLILMDIRMPVMDGIEATQIIKDELHCKAPAIALTGEAGEDVKNQCDEVGFDGFRNKPLKRDMLLAVLRDYARYAVPTGPSQ